MPRNTQFDQRACVTVILNILIALNVSFIIISSIIYHHLTSSYEHHSKCSFSVHSQWSSTNTTNTLKNTLACQRTPSPYNIIILYYNKLIYHHDHHGPTLALTSNFDILGFQAPPRGSELCLVMQMQDTLMISTAVI